MADLRSAIQQLHDKHSATHESSLMVGGDHLKAEVERHMADHHDHIDRRLTEAMSQFQVHAASQGASREGVHMEEGLAMQLARDNEVRAQEQTQLAIFVEETCGNFQQEMGELKEVMASFQQQLVDVETLFQAQHGQAARQIHMPEPQPMACAVSQDAFEFTIVGASGLKNMDWGPTGKSDPYCICRLKGSNGEEKGNFETTEIKNTLEPTWEQKAKFEQIAQGDTLLFEVYDKDFGKQDDFQGKVELQFVQFYPNGFQGDVPLVDEKGGPAGFLQLSIPEAKVPMQAFDHGAMGESSAAALRQDLECLTDAVRKELETLHEQMQMLHGQIQVGGGQPGGSDMMQLVQALDNEAGQRLETDELLKQEMVEVSNKVEQLWHGVEAMSAESQNHRTELQKVREHGARGRGEGVKLPTPGGEPVQIPEGTEAGDYAFQLISAVQEEFSAALEQDRAEVTQQVEGLRLDLGDAIERHEARLRAELVQAIEQERNERNTEQLEQQHETHRMFDELTHSLQSAQRPLWGACTWT
jgi:hypothetical protein